MGAFVAEWPSCYTLIQVAQILKKGQVMSKLRILLLIGLAVAVAACGGPTATPVSVPTAVVAAPPAATQAAPPTAVAATPTQPSSGLSVTPAGVSNPPKLDPVGMCKPASAPKPVPNFPASLPADQSRGASQAPVTLYEYSDFQ